MAGFTVVYADKGHATGVVTVTPLAVQLDMTEVVRSLDCGYGWLPIWYRGSVDVATSAASLLKTKKSHVNSVVTVAGCAVEVCGGIAPLSVPKGKWWSYIKCFVELLCP